MYTPTPLETIEYHHSMLSDKLRTESYFQAIHKAVRPGDTVLDIGTGTGVLAYFACMAGARHVYAVEQGPIVKLARRICKRNELEDRVTFLPDWSTHVALQERVDIVVTETIGNFAFDEGILGWIADAKERLLVDGGRIIPHSLKLVVVPVDDPDAYTLIDGLSRDCCSIDVSPARSVAASRLYLRDIQRGTFLSTPKRLAGVELGCVSSAEVNGQVSFIANKDGILYGIGGWFEAELVPGIALSNAPPNRAPSWKQGLLPLEEPLAVHAGDNLHVRIRSDMKDGHCHWWWHVAHEARVASEMDQLQAPVRNIAGSTFAAEPAAENDLPDPYQTPIRGEAADIDMFVLQAMDGASPLGDIAARLAANRPAAFNNYEDALRHVQAVAARYA
jgi:protein arginine N-methyltransferase 1